MTTELEALRVLVDVAFYGAFFVAWCMGYRSGRAGV